MSLRDDLSQQFISLLEAEQERRRRQASTAAGGNPREVLMNILREMSRRLKADPNYRPPTAAQDRKATHKIEMFFRRRGYLRTS